MPRRSRSRRGATLVELIVALLLLELAGAAALAAVLAGERIGRSADAGIAVDRRRWVEYRRHELAPGCAAASVPSLQGHAFPAEGGRPAATALVGCGP